MSTAAGEARTTRLVLFEIGDTAYALPIADVLEVCDRAESAAIPAVPRAVAGAMNHHGDALPVMAREVLFEGARGLEAPEHVLVLAGAGGAAARLGVPVDRVLGLADLPLGPAGGSGIVSERRAHGDRVLAVLDARALAQRAARAIQEAARTA